MRPLLLMLAITAALILATRNKAPVRVRIYLWAELATTAIIEACLWLFGWGSVYRVIYVLARPVELLAALYVASPTIQAVPFAFMLVCLAIVGLPAHSGFDQWLAMVEGGMFAIAGTAMARDLEPHRAMYGTLAILWTLLAVFDMGLAMGYEMPTWQALNFWWPSAVCIGAFVLLAILVSSGKRVDLPQVCHRDTAQ